jgi:hypothetical protein
MVVVLARADRRSALRPPRELARLTEPRDAGFRSNEPEPVCIGYGRCTSLPLLVGRTSICSIEPVGMLTSAFRCNV